MNYRRPSRDGASHTAQGYGTRTQEPDGAWWRERRRMRQCPCIEAWRRCKEGERKGKIPDGVVGLKGRSRRDAGQLYGQQAGPERITLWVSYHDCYNKDEKDCDDGNRTALKTSAAPGKFCISKILGLDFFDRFILLFFLLFFFFFLHRRFSKWWEKYIRSKVSLINIYFCIWEVKGDSFNIDGV